MTGRSAWRDAENKDRRELVHMKKIQKGSNRADGAKAPAVGTINAAGIYRVRWEMKVLRKL